MSMSNFPVGATWTGKETGKGGRIAIIWLECILGDVEIWKWRWVYPDGSQDPFEMGWGPSYQSCKRQIPFNCRMKRM